MEDDRDADDAIRALDRTEFGRKGRRLRIEWAKVLELIFSWPLFLHILENNIFYVTIWLFKNK
jgi:hypothetical protein